jgi:hypothetical protein
VLVALVLGIIIAGIVALLVVKWHLTNKAQIMQTIMIAEQMKQRLNHNDKKQIPSDNKPAFSHIPTHQTPVTPEPLKIDCITGKTTIAQSLNALAKKYRVEQITLATVDGLLLASSREEGAVHDAATYSQVFTADPQSKNPDILVFSVEHKGSTIIGSVRKKTVMSSEIKKQMKDDTKDILNRWI